MNYDKKFPMFKKLMENFHQDWKCDFHSDREVLQDFALRWPKEEVRQCIYEIKTLIRTANFVELEQPFDDWGVCLRISPNECERWLKDAVKILQATFVRSGGIILESTKNRSRRRDPISRIQEYLGLYLLMCQFDDYWLSDFRSERNVFLHFRSTSSKEDLMMCVSDIEKILAHPYTDEEIDQILRDDFDGRPPYKGVGKVRDWLRHAKRRCHV